MERKRETNPRIAIPAPRPVPQEEIARRHEVYDRLMRLREQMKPLDIPAEELVRQAREEAERGG